LATDKAKTPQDQALWANIAKRYNGRGLHGISIACGGLIMWIGSPADAITKCALCEFMLNNVSYRLHIQPFDHKGLYDQLSKNEQELRFS